MLKHAWKVQAGGCKPAKPALFGNSLKCGKCKYVGHCIAVHRYNGNEVPYEIVRMLSGAQTRHKYFIVFHHLFAVFI